MDYVLFAVMFDTGSCPVVAEDPRSCAEYQAFLSSYKIHVCRREVFLFFKKSLDSGIRRFLRRFEF